MKTATFQRFTWRGYTVEATGWLDGHDVEWDSIIVIDDNNVEVDHLTLLIECEGAEPLSELATKFIECCAEDRIEMRNGTYFSSCD